MFVEENYIPLRRLEILDVHWTVSERAQVGKMSEEGIMYRYRKTDIKSGME